MTKVQQSWVEADAARSPLGEEVRKRIEALKGLLQPSEGLSLDWLQGTALIREGEFESADTQESIYVLLFAEHVLVATLLEDGSILVKGHIPLAHATLNLCVLNADSADRFQLWGVANKSYKLDVLPPSSIVAEAWKNDLGKLILAASPNIDNIPGWQHWRIIGTLHSAAFHGDTDFIRQQLKRGAETTGLNLKDMSGLAPIHIATIMGRDAVVSLLLEAGADISAATRDEDSLLHLAVRAHNINLVKVFIQAGVNVNLTRRSDRRTPLHEACLNPQNPDIVDTLLISGAWPNVPLVNSQTALQICFNVNRPTATGKVQLVSHALNIACLLLAHGARLPLPLEKWLDSCNIDEADLTPMVVAHRLFTERIEPALSESNKRLRMVNDVSWEVNGSSGACRACMTPFGILSRRHHCRACGKLVCQACSTKTLNLSVYKSNDDHIIKPTRVCDGCYNRVMHQLVNDNFFSIV